MQTHPIRRIGREHPDYPIVLHGLKRPPDAIYVRGVLPSRRGIAIVGTRCATDEALRYTRELAAWLTRSGLCIWSGGASGIDRAAHEGALSAGGNTVVVMGTGFDHTYPVDHREMFERVIEEDGAWLSPFAPSQPGSRWSFLMRNEVLASLVDAVVLVQAPLRSGARSTAAAARRLGKPLYVVPSAPWDASGAGCVQELRRGGRPLYGARDLMDILDGNEQLCLDGLMVTGVREAQVPEDLDEQQRGVIKSLRARAVYPDEICEETGLSAGMVSAALLTLTLRKVVVQGSDGRFRLLTI